MGLHKNRPDEGFMRAAMAASAAPQVKLRVAFSCVTFLGSIDGNRRKTEGTNTC